MQSRKNEKQKIYTERYIIKRNKPFVDCAELIARRITQLNSTSYSGKRKVSLRKLKVFLFEWLIELEKKNTESRYVDLGITV